MSRLHNPPTSTNTNGNSNFDDENTVKIFLTTDNHVGYKESDPIIGDDSAVTFHEIMMLAKDKEADMVLQSGDLFHINKPSKQSLYQVMRSLRTACLGDRPCELEVLNHGTLGLEADFDHVNYEDPNYNVAMPVFAISGNHDDSGGSSVKLSPMDVLSISGLINYYGRIVENDNITVTPVLLRKGQTKIALYGISNVRDERLYRTFRDSKVKFLRPSEQTDDWFNIICVHQNHTSHTETNYLPEGFLPDFIDLVIWGHEHECRIDPITNPQHGFQVLQPGSSVATSLSEAEAVPKYVGMLKVRGKSCKLEKIRLKTVRPFAMDTVYLSQELPNDSGRVKKGDIIRFMTRKVEELLSQAEQSWNESREGLDQEDLDRLHEMSQSTRLGRTQKQRRARTVRMTSNAEQGEDEFAEDGGLDEGDELDGMIGETETRDARSCPLPLIRLRVEYSGDYEVENATRFSNRFVGRVANVNEIVHYFRKKTGGGASSNARANASDLTLDNNDDAADEGMDLGKIHVQQLVEGYLKQAELDILKQDGLDEAVNQFIDKDDKNALKIFVDGSLEERISELLKGGLTNEAEMLQLLSLESTSTKSRGTAGKKAAATPATPRAKRATKAKATKENATPPPPPSKRVTRERRQPPPPQPTASSTVVDESDDSFVEVVPSSGSPSEDEYEEEEEAVVVPTKKRGGRTATKTQKQPTPVPRVPVTQTQTATASIKSSADDDIMEIDSDDAFE